MKKAITHKPKSKRYKVKRWKQKHKVGRKNYGSKISTKRNIVILKLSGYPNEINKKTIEQYTKPSGELHPQFFFGPPPGPKQQLLLDAINEEAEKHGDYIPGGKEKYREKLMNDARESLDIAHELDMRDLKGDKWSPKII